MRYRALDENGDYSFGRGGANYLTNQPEAVAQAVKTRLQLLAGEWFLDLAEGTPYAQGVFGKQTRDNYDFVIRDRILNTEGVTAITEYESALDDDTRQLTVSVTIDTRYGDARLAASIGEAR